jgi:hypothetical protein
MLVPMGPAKSSLSLYAFLFQDARKNVAIVCRAVASVVRRWHTSASP